MEWPVLDLSVSIPGEEAFAQRVQLRGDDAQVPELQLLRPARDHVAVQRDGGGDAERVRDRQLQLSARAGARRFPVRPDGTGAEHLRADRRLHPDTQGAAGGRGAADGQELGADQELHRLAEPVHRWGVEAVSLLFAV